MKDIVIFTIGPIQSYISAARRTQDLWAGSRLLSDVMRAALESVTPDDALVFPRRTAGDEWPHSLPNRAVAVIESGRGAAVAEQMAEAARARWKVVAAAVRDWFHTNVITAAGPWDWREVWERQVRDWLEVYWIACPWDDMTQSYGKAYRQASELLDARKLTRHFPDHREYDVKSTLDGAYQALRGKERGEANAAKAFWEKAARVGNAPIGNVRRGERLSAIDLIKRFAQDAKQLRDDKTRFPSTSSIACADYRLALMENWEDKEEKPGQNRVGTKQAVTDFVAALDALVEQFPTALEQRRLRFAANSEEPIPILKIRAGGNEVLAGLARYDGDYFYSDFYTEARFIDQLGRELGAKLTETELKAVGNAKEALSKLYNRTDALDIPRPALYYAVIALDGDQVGKKLSHKEVTQAHHQAVSGAMNRFARQDVPRIAGQEHPAVWVYAGGDDALVLSPVSCALVVADTLRQAFEATVGMKLNIVDADTQATASAGIAIVHQQNPLQTGIRLAKAAEKAAKSKPYNRNALVVHRLTRGSTPLLVGSKWEVGDNGATLSIADQIIALQGYIASGKLSGKFAYELREEAAALAGVAIDGRKAELARLMERHTPNEKTRPQTKKVAEQLAELAASLDKVEVKVYGKTENKMGIEQVAEWAVLARFLATGGRRA